MSIGLAPAQLAAVFPFHVAFDADLRVAQVGDAWRRMCADVRPGVPAPDLFKLVRPDLPFTVETLRTLRHSLVVLECLAGGLPLRGQCLDGDDGRTLFLGSPLVRDIGDLKRFGLSIEDWPPHESVSDLLFMLRSKEVALSEARALSERLGRQGADLQAAAEALTDAVAQREEARARAAAREASLRAILDTAAEGIITIDERGIVQTFNAAAVKLFGWAADEMIGRNVSVLMPPDLQAQHDGFIQRYLATGIATIVGRGREVEGVHRDGTRIPLYLAVSELDTPRGRTFTGILHDLRELKRARHALEATEHRTRLIVDSALDAVITMDHDGRVTLWNAQAEATFGWTREEAIGRSMVELIVPESMTRAHEAGLRRYLTTGVAHVIDRRVEIAARHRDGHEFPVELSITAIHEGGPPSFSAFVRDISVRRRGEQLLKVQYEVTFLLDTVPTLREAAPLLLRAICGFLGWDFGAFWLQEADGAAVRSIAQWHAPGLEASRFAAETREMQFEPGAGLAGRVFASGRHVWLPRAAEAPWFLRSAAAAEAGLVSGIAFPVHVSGKPGAVIEFFSRRYAQPGDDMIDTLSGLATQIGQFVERRRAETALRQSENRLRSVVDHMLEGLVVFDRTGRIVQANRAFAEMFGYTPDTVRRLPVLQFLPDRDDYRDPHNTARLYAQALGRVTEHEGRRANGELFPIQVQVYEFSTADGTFVAGHVRDLSQERESDRLKKQFVASVSHELRTPLTAIRGSLSLLTLGAAGDLPGEAKDVLAIAERNATRLVGIINDLLDVERIQAGLLSLSPSWFDLDRAIERARETVAPLAEQAGIAIAAAANGARVWGDEARIVQVLVNLLGNAIKFSPRDTRVDVRGRTGDEAVVIQVRDQGRGVPEHLKAIIFQPFRQAEASDSRTHGGSGIGLAICRAIVAQHGGDIGVESQPGEGSTFWFTLPNRDATLSAHPEGDASVVP